MWIGCPKTPVQYSAAENEESASKSASSKEGSERSSGANGGSGVGGSDGGSDGAVGDAEAEVAEVVGEAENLLQLEPQLDEDQSKGLGLLGSVLAVGWDGLGVL